MGIYNHSYIFCITYVNGNMDPIGLDVFIGFRFHLILKILEHITLYRMEQLLDSSLDVKSAPPVIRRKKGRAPSSKRKTDEHIDELVMIALQRFFDHKEHSNVLWQQLGDTREKSISLRVIDWFVTNYSKKNAVYFKTNDKTCIVWQEYKQKLRGYSKQRFDPFCRHSRIRFHLSENRSIITTVGQLNFFRWAIENEILSYIEKHKETIEKDMNESYQVHYSNRQRPDVKQHRKKRIEISKVANQGICLFKLKGN